MDLMEERRRIAARVSLRATTLTIAFAGLVLVIGGTLIGSIETSHFVPPPVADIGTQTADTWTAGKTPSSPPPPAFPDEAKTAAATSRGDFENSPMNGNVIMINAS